MTPEQIQEYLWDEPPGLFYRSGCWHAVLHAPESVTGVSLVGEFIDDPGVPLEQTTDGAFWWFIGGPDSFAEPPQPGQRYRFEVTLEEDQSELWQDPAARWVEDTSFESSSLVTKSDQYQWGDGDYQRPQWEDLVIYELHPLRFSDRNGSAGPYDQVIEELDGDGTNDYLQRLGITAIELMPVSEFPGDHSWGYNPAYLYAAESSYGDPDDLKRLVDTAHRQGIAVILDVVLNHLSDYQNVLQYVDPETYLDGSTTWGPMPNFDDPVARHYLVNNLRYLLEEYHLDGFRFDATRLMHIDDDWNITEAGSGGGWHLLREIRSELKSVDPDVLLIAEELPNDWYITGEDIGSTYDGDVHGPFDSQWNDSFHDRFREVLTGDHLDNLYEAMTPYGDSWHDGVNYVESHDEVGNHDARIAAVGRDGRGLEMARIGVTGTLLFRNIPMLFMGQEAGESRQFHIDWWDDRLPLDQYESDPQQSKLLAWTKRMIEIRRDDTETMAESDVQLPYIHDANGIAVFTRGDSHLVVLNFRSTTFQTYDIGEQGSYHMLASTDWPEFALESSVCGEMPTEPIDLSLICIPAYGAIVYKRAD